jgi:predicted transcriptional regulator
MTTIRLTISQHVALKAIADRTKVSMHAILLEAVDEYLKRDERERIDAEFAEMANDPRYQEEALQICNDFRCADAEVELVLLKAEAKK